MGRPKKSRFSDLDEDFKDKAAAMSDDDLAKTISRVAMDQEDLLKLKEEDQQLKEAQEAAKDAGAQYRDGTKLNRLRIAFCKDILESRGKR